MPLISSAEYLNVKMSALETNRSLGAMKMSRKTFITVQLEENNMDVR
jgi:hypothetical protein